MTPDELLSRLAPVRIPAEFAAFGPRDALLFAALGIVTALLLAPLLRLLTERRPSRLQQVHAEIARMRPLDTEARITGLAALLQSLEPDARLADAPPHMLYDPRATRDPASLEQAVLTAARNRRQA